VTRLRLVGDIAANREIADPPGSALPLLGDSDLTIANLECPLTERGTPAPKPSVLRGPVALAQQLRDLGVNACSLANNHALDYGADGLTDTLAALAGAGAAWAGAGRDLASAAAPTFLTSQDGRQVALISVACTVPPGFRATDDSPGVAGLTVNEIYHTVPGLDVEQPGTVPFVATSVDPTESSLLLDEVRAARSEADIVLVAVHWGVAWAYRPPNQGPLAEYQVPLGRALVDAGADVVIGHHSHALDPIEWWGSGLILYGTGNFLFHPDPPGTIQLGSPGLARYRPILESGPWFDSAVFDVEIVAGRRTELRVIPVVLNADGDPELAEEPDRDRILESIVTSSRLFHPHLSSDPSGRLLPALV
jgi:poly-gamma-glutamate synthesis protein (capsule biosynthesis protein)